MGGPTNLAKVARDDFNYTFFMVTKPLIVLSLFLLIVMVNSTEANIRNYRSNANGMVER